MRCARSREVCGQSRVRDCGRSRGPRRADSAGASSKAAV